MKNNMTVRRSADRISVYSSPTDQFDDSDVLSDSPVFLHQFF